jgi:hypothetical protein
MQLAEKMFSRSTEELSCSKQLQGQRRIERFVDNLFSDDWEVFVIKRNDEDHSFRWFTLCCEAARHNA